MQWKRAAPGRGCPTPQFQWGPAAPMSQRLPQQNQRHMQFWPNLSQWPSLLNHFQHSLLSRDTHWDDSIHGDPVLCQLLGKHAHLPGTESSQRPQSQRGSYRCACSNIPTCTGQYARNTSEGDTRNMSSVSRVCTARTRYSRLAFAWPAAS